MVNRNSFEALDMKASIVDIGVAILCSNHETTVSSLFAERVTERIVHLSLFCRSSVDRIVEVEGSESSGLSSSTPVHNTL